jgi:hypothetical protein
MIFKRAYQPLGVRVGMDVVWGDLGGMGLVNSVYHPLSAWWLLFGLGAGEKIDLIGGGLP